MNKMAVSSFITYFTNSKFFVENKFLKQYCYCFMPC